MANNSTLVVEQGVSLALPIETRSTLSQEDGRPDVRRFFPGGPAVYAVSSMATTDVPPIDAVGLAAGDVVSVYRVYEGYSRTVRPAPQIEGAEEAMLLDFVWEDSSGVLMHSLVVVAGVPGRTIVVHGALPELHGRDALSAMEATLMSCHLNEGLLEQS